MNKALRVVVILLLLLSIGALTLGVMLFQKRELLKGRTQKLENTIVQLGALVEAEPPTLPSKPQYPARDISDCTPEILDNPQLSDFWDKYKAELEIRDLQMLDLKKRQLELMTYYKLDLITGKVERDPVTGYKVTTGDGTMQAVLDTLIAKTEAQFNRLNDTRQQLTAVRTELVAAITELNQRKKDHRASLKEIVELKAEIEKLKARIAALEQEVATLKEQKAALEQQVAEKDKQIATLEGEKQELTDEVKKLKQEIADLRDITKRGGTGLTMTTAQPFKNIEPGQKGKVVSVNEKGNFVILELTDAFLAEIFKDPQQQDIPAVELMVKRAGTPEKFITKVRIVQIKRSERLGIANILNDWQQAPLEKGDVAFY